MVENSEKLRSKNEYKGDNDALLREGLEHQERLREQLEKTGELSKENLDDIKKEALEKAHSSEKKLDKAERTLSPAERRKTQPDKVGRKASYKRTMKQVQSEMSTPSRTFSKFIHLKPIEKTSEAIGSTLARPDAILSGAIVGFAFTLAIYLIAKYYGYPLSGFESIAGFIVGWAVGLLYDYLKIEITGRT